MIVIDEHPFSPKSVAAENGSETKSDRSYRLFLKECERLLGHSLDGNDVDASGDGFSLDEAYDVWRRGKSAHAYVAMVVTRNRYFTRNACT